MLIFHSAFYVYVTMRTSEKTIPQKYPMNICFHNLFKYVIMGRNLHENKQHDVNDVSKLLANHCQNLSWNVHIFCNEYNSGENKKFFSSKICIVSVMQNTDMDIL